MNLNLDFKNLDLKRLGLAALAFRKLFMTLVIVGLLGYTGYQISRITAVEPDQAYITLKKADKKTAVPSLRVSKEVQDKLRQLQPAGDTSIPVNVGKANPFSLN